jgi:DNA-binding Lrp family transcriptional regulator
LVGRSRTSVQSRIERLEKRGVIVGYGVRLAPEHGLGAVAMTASVDEMDQVIDRIGALDGVERTTSSIILSTKFER